MRTLCSICSVRRTLETPVLQLTKLCASIPVILEKEPTVSTSSILFNRWVVSQTGSCVSSSGWTHSWRCTRSSYLCLSRGPKPSWFATNSSPTKSACSSSQDCLPWQFGTQITSTCESWRYKCFSGTLKLSPCSWMTWDWAWPFGCASTWFFWSRDPSNEVKQEFLCTCGPRLLRPFFWAGWRSIIIWCTCNSLSTFCCW